MRSTQASDAKAIAWMMCSLREGVIPSEERDLAASPAKSQREILRAAQNDMPASAHGQSRASRACSLQVRSPFFASAFFFFLRCHDLSDLN